MDNFTRGDYRFCKNCSIGSYITAEDSQGNSYSGVVLRADGDTRYVNGEDGKVHVFKMEYDADLDERIILLNPGLDNSVTVGDKINSGEMRRVVSFESQDKKEYLGN